MDLKGVAGSIEAPEMGKAASWGCAAAGDKGQHLRVLAVSQGLDGAPEPLHLQGFPAAGQPPRHQLVGRLHQARNCINRDTWGESVPTSWCTADLLAAQDSGEPGSSSSCTEWHRPCAHRTAAWGLPGAGLVAGVGHPVSQVDGGTTANEHPQLCHTHMPAAATVSASSLINCVCFLCTTQRQAGASVRPGLQLNSRPQATQMPTSAAASWRCHSAGVPLPPALLPALAEGHRPAWT